MELHHSGDVTVQEDGVKLGWVVISVLAALSFGMYMATNINPLLKAVEHTDRNLDRHEAQCSANTKRLRDDLNEQRDSIRELTILMTRLENDFRHLEVVIDAKDS